MSFSLNLRSQEIEFVNKRGGVNWVESILRRKIREWETAYEEDLPAGYDVIFDDALAESNLPYVTENVTSHGPAELETIYYRVMKNGCKSCIEYIYYWNFQVFPPHSYDYQPIYVYLEDGKPNQTAFDFWHYVARVVSGTPPLQTWGPWHSFSVIEKSKTNHMQTPLVELDGAVLGKWYHRNPKARFEIRQKLTDPWMVRDWSTFRDARVLTQAKGFFIVTPETREIIELDEATQGRVNRELFAMAVKDIDAFYQSSVKTLAIAKLIPEKHKTKPVISSVREIADDTREEMIQELRGAGYLELRKGHIRWTPEGREIRKILRSSLD
jgi:hypothetical protein